MTHDRPCRPIRPLSALALAAAMAVASAQPAPASTDRYNRAHELYEVGHYAEAFTIFAALADEGHCDAARIAQQMVRYGKALYFTTFEVTRERLELWQRRPGCTVVRAGG